MSKRRYKIEVTNLAALGEKYPTAVNTTIIPEHVLKTHNYGIIAKLLDCGIDVPGIIFEVKTNKTEIIEEIVKKKHDH